MKKMIIGIILTFVTTSIFASDVKGKVQIVRYKGGNTLEAQLEVTETKTSNVSVGGYVTLKFDGTQEETNIYLSQLLTVQTTQTIVYANYTSTDVSHLYTYRIGEN